MNGVLKAALIAATLGTATFLAAAPANAHDYRRSSVSVYIDTGNIAIGYRNGYFDHQRRWHSWRSRAHWRAYCDRGGRYHDYNYDRRRDRGRHRGHHRRHRD